MRVVTQNVQALPPMKHRQVRHDVRATALSADVIVWQEIRPARYRYAVRSLPRGTWAHYMGPVSGGCPISWRRKRYELVDRGSVLLHPGKRKVCERRVIAWVLLREIATGNLFIVNNAHYVSKAWSNARPAEVPMRRGIWEAGNATHRELLARWVKSGFAVVGGGDFNRGGYPVVGEKVENRHVHYGQFGPHVIDHLYVINGDHVRWNPLQSRTLDERESDHKGRQIITKPVAWRGKQ